METICGFEINPSVWDYEIEDEEFIYDELEYDELERDKRDYDDFLEKLMQKEDEYYET